jgi:hypothetical protein
MVRTFNFEMMMIPALYPIATCENIERGSHGCDRMVVGFTTTYAISAYHH